MIDKNQYHTPEWFSKRKEILKRDNYTCQNCLTFNPSEGTVTVFNQKENDIELHDYESYNSEYSLHSKKHKITLKIEYGWGLWLVMPILQIHHKRYINGRSIWAYDKDDLVTLCSFCHTTGHNIHEIPIYDSGLKIITKKLLPPEDNNPGRKHGFKPWVFINNESGEYELSSVQPKVKYFVFNNDPRSMEEIQKIVDNMHSFFMERFLPDYTFKKPN